MYFISDELVLLKQRGTRIPSTIRRKKASKTSQASLNKPVVPATLDDPNFKAYLGCRVSSELALEA